MQWQENKTIVLSLRREEDGKGQERNRSSKWWRNRIEENGNSIEKKINKWSNAERQQGELKKNFLYVPSTIFPKTHPLSICESYPFLILFPTLLLTRFATSHEPWLVLTLLLLFLVHLFIAGGHGLRFRDVHFAERCPGVLRRHERAGWGWRQLAPPPRLSLQPSLPHCFFLTNLNSLGLPLHFKLCVGLHGGARSGVTGAEQTQPQLRSTVRCCATLLFNKCL